MMNKKIAIGILSAMLLTGCTNATTNESITHMISQSQETESISTTVDTDTKEVQAAADETYTDNPDETDVHFFSQANSPNILYNGELYLDFGITSAQTKLDGKYYEVICAEKEEGCRYEARIDTEWIKSECEYIGKSIANPDPFATPTQELEVTGSDEVFELYKIDDYRILLYSELDQEIPDSWTAQAIVYPGTYRLHYVLIKEDVAIPYINLYHVPNEEWWTLQGEQNNQTTDAE